MLTVGSLASHMAGQVKLSGAQVPSLPKPPHPPGLRRRAITQQQLVGMGVGIPSLN